MDSCKQQVNTGDHQASARCGARPADRTSAAATGTGARFCHTRVRWVYITCTVRTKSKLGAELRLEKRLPALEDLRRASPWLFGTISAPPAGQGDSFILAWRSACVSERSCGALCVHQFASVAGVGMLGALTFVGGFHLGGGGRRQRTSRSGSVSETSLRLAMRRAACQCWPQLAEALSCAAHSSPKPSLAQLAEALSCAAQSRRGQKSECRAAAAAGRGPGFSPAARAATPPTRMRAAAMRAHILRARRQIGAEARRASTVPPSALRGLTQTKRSPARRAMRGARGTACSPVPAPLARFGYSVCRFSHNNLFAVI